jgi:hypothetical protein
MNWRQILIALTVLLIGRGNAWAQPPAAAPRVASDTDARWHSPERSPRVATGSGVNPAAQAAPNTNLAPIEALAPVNTPAAAPIAKVKHGAESLPNERGQVWREYDISPYTLRVTTTKRPEQAIVDWIFRETGFEVWHSDVVSVLAADNRTLRVYHTPEMQAIVGDLVDRFVNTQAETYAFSIRVVTLDNPGWRSMAQRYLKAVPVQTPGVQAWVLAKEDAMLLMAELRKRSDFREHSSPHLLVNNGQATVINATRPRSYVRNIFLQPEAFPGFRAEMATLDEGFVLEFSPLLSRDERTIDAAIKCNVDQIEKLISVPLDVATPVSQRQRTQIDVPQISQYRLHERFRWPAEQVMLVGVGMTPTPVHTEPGVMRMALPFTSAPRSDLLIMLEGKGRLGENSVLPGAASRPTDSFRGRY